MLNSELVSVAFAVIIYLLCTILFFIFAIVLTDFKGFKRADIKKRGWDSLRAGKFWMALAVSAVFTLIGGSVSGVSGGVSPSLSLNFNEEVDLTESLESTASSLGDVSSYIGVFAVAFVFIMLIAIVVGICFSVFVSNILVVGLYRFFILNLYGRPDFKELFFGFTNGNYTKILKIMFKKTLYEFLWSLLFIIPGIIKTYEYFMVPFILAENPDIDEETAFRLSKEMMTGNKWRTYVLSISFIGWEMLSVFTLGFGLYFLMPYIYATLAALYEKLRMAVSYEDREKYLNDEMFGFKRVEVIESHSDDETMSQAGDENSDVDKSEDEINEVINEIPNETEGKVDF